MHFIYVKDFYVLHHSEDAQADAQREVGSAVQSVLPLCEEQAQVSHKLWAFPFPCPLSLHLGFLNVPPSCAGGACRSKMG